MYSYIKIRGLRKAAEKIGTKDKTTVPDLLSETKKKKKSDTK